MLESLLISFLVFYFARSVIVFRKDIIDWLS